MCKLLSISGWKGPWDESKCRSHPFGCHTDCCGLRTTEEGFLPRTDVAWCQANDKMEEAAMSWCLYTALPPADAHYKSRVRQVSSSAPHFWHWYFNQVHYYGLFETIHWHGQAFNLIVGKDFHGFLNVHSSSFLLSKAVAAVVFYLAIYVHRNLEEDNHIEEYQCQNWGTLVKWTWTRPAPGGVKTSKHRAT